MINPPVRLHAVQQPFPIEDLQGKKDAYYCCQNVTDDAKQHRIGRNDATQRERPHREHRRRLLEVERDQVRRENPGAERHQLRAREVEDAHPPEREPHHRHERGQRQHRRSQLQPRLHE